MAFDGVMTEVQNYYGTYSILRRARNVTLTREFS